MPKVKIDPLFAFAVLALCAIGLIMIFSASPTIGVRYGDYFFFIKRHLFFLAAGFTAFIYALRLNIQTLRQRANLLFVISIVLLLVVFIPGVGRRVSGAARWIDLGLLSFQPSELIKFTSLLFLANYLAANKKMIGNFWRGLLPPLLMIGLVAAIIMKQPDMGTALSIVIPAFIMLVLAGADWRQLGGLGAVGLAAITALATTSLYRLKRLLAYLDPYQDPQGIGFQIIQSLVAVGSGGFWGRGLGASRQKFFYLPQQSTDFIFAILCEELGLIGSAAVVLLFVLFAVRGLQLAAKCQDDFQYLLVSGLVSWLTIQALINISVVIGLIPTTGIPLPFISYGGTATIIELFAVGVILKSSLPPGKRT